MTEVFDDEDRVFTVVVNDEDQYSIWPDDRPAPTGWSAVGRTGRKQECLDYIAEVWTDMRPRSLRLQMDGEPA
ncbi:MAG: MbtH family NRPS accessory protein [Hamadaea sp.]|nr:MbtH family NRPS accessory protein [Hamadaea sp.]